MNEKQQPIVNSTDEAYSYWFRCVSTGISAEKAWGSGVVKRVLYKDLINDNYTTIRDILNFLMLDSRNNFVEDCVGPLSIRLNSSNVPVDAQIAYESEILENRWSEIRTYSNQLLMEPFVSYSRNENLVKEQITCFNSRIKFNATLDAEYQLAQVRHSKLQADFEERTEWAKTLDLEVLQNRKVISELQSELESRTAWALSQSSDIASRDQVIRSLQAELQDRTNWALKLSGELGDAKEMIKELTQKLNDRPGQ